MNCSKCGLSATCAKPVQLGNGTSGAKVMVVQESPFISENMRGQYMGGRAGKLFRAALSEVGVSVDDIYYTAVVKCSTPDDRLPTNTEAKICQDYLFAEIEVVKPQVIIPTGNLSLKYLMGLTGITKHRGKVTVKNGISYLPIISPNLVLKQPKYMDMFSEDMITLGSLLSGESVTGRPDINLERTYCDTYEQCVKEIRRLMELPSGSRLVIDLETTKTNPFLDKVVVSTATKNKYPESERNKIVAIGFSDRPGFGSAIPLYHRQTRLSGNQIGTVVKLIRILLERDDLEIITQSGKFELKWLRHQLDILVKTAKWDTMLMHYLGVTEEQGTHGLDDFAWQYTSMGGYDNELNSVKPKGIDEGNYDLIPWDILKVYLAGDCDCTFRAFDVFYPRIMESEDFKWIWENLMVPGYYTIHEIECNGIHTNVSWLDKISKTYPVELARLSDKLHEYPEVLAMERESAERWAERVAIGGIAKSQRTEEEQFKFEKYKKYDPSKGGWGINFGSVKQLGELLFNRIGLHTNILTDTEAPSTNDDSLKYMMPQHSICKRLMEWRKINHLNNSFVASLYSHLDKNGLIHPSYGLHGTVTGRMSSTEPRNWALSW